MFRWSNAETFSPKYVQRAECWNYFTQICWDGWMRKPFLQNTFRWQNAETFSPKYVQRAECWDFLTKICSDGWMLKLFHPNMLRWLNTKALSTKYIQMAECWDFLTKICSDGWMLIYVDWCFLMLIDDDAQIRFNQVFGAYLRSSSSHFLTYCAPIFSYLNIRLFPDDTDIQPGTDGWWHDGKKELKKKRNKKRNVRKLGLNKNKGWPEKRKHICGNGKKAIDQ